MAKHSAPRNEHSTATPVTSASLQTQKLQIVLGAAAVAAIGASAPAQAQDKPALVFVVNAASDFWKLAEAGANTAQAELPDYDLQFRYPAQGTAALQNALMDDLVAAGADAIMISSVDPKTSAAATRAFGQAASSSRPTLSAAL
jgi:ABC-type sugar transport system substrate-binding protein